MKKAIRTVAFLATIGMLAAGCQKETNLFDASTLVQTETTVCYSINGATGNVNLPNEDAWDAFMNRMMALAREGYHISLKCGSVFSDSLSKETIVYTTDNEADAISWAKKMAKDGYQVDITYNENGTYTCIAIK
ncbi:MAG: hypothetical protein K5650_08050 [Bacteroidales bacterium]|nr:hypothetical protein [Bacteroidales bacterium]